MKRTLVSVAIGFVAGALVMQWWTADRRPSAPVVAPELAYPGPVAAPPHTALREVGVPEPGAVGPCQVTRVIDGDTVDVACGAESGRVRLLRIDTPERGESGYQEAGNALRGAVAGRPIYLVYETPGVPDTDRYGRFLAYLYVNGFNVNVEMVRAGWSPFWTKYGAGRFAEEFAEAEAEAQGKALGYGDGEEYEDW